MPRGSRTPPRSALHLADLLQRRPVATRLMNVKIPGNLVHAIDSLAQQLDANKTEVVVALLTAGLEVARRQR